MDSARERIFAADDLKREKVDIPEWPVEVYARAMTGAERDRFEEDATGAKSGNVRGVMARVVITCTVDAEGRRIFREGDEDRLQAKSADAMSRLFDTAIRLSAITERETEDLVGNSEGGRSGDSGSA